MAMLFRARQKVQFHLMPASKKQVLLLCYGNPSRLDDGLGPALAEKIEKLSLAGVTVDTDYQLTVEDAIDAAKNDIVVFVDAAVKGTEPFFFIKTVAADEVTFSSHSTSPGSILHLAENDFGGKMKGYSLGIRGYEFNEFGEVLSDKAISNLRASFDFLVSAIESGDFEGSLTGSME